MAKQPSPAGPELGPDSLECFSIDICKFKDTDDVIRLTVSDFKGKLYLSLRRWFFSTWDEEYFPTGDGITLPYTDEVIDGLFVGFSHLLSNAELNLFYDFRNRQKD